MYYDVLGNKFFQTSTPRPTDYFITKVSLQLSDVHNTTLYYENLTFWNLFLLVKMG